VLFMNLFTYPGGEHDFHIRLCSRRLTVAQRLPQVEQELLNNAQLLVQSVTITNKVVSSNPVHGEVYSIQHCVIKFVSDLRQVCGFLRVPRFPPLIKLTVTKKLKYCSKYH